MTSGVCTLSSWVRLLDLAVAIHNMKLGIETGRPVHDSHPKTGVYCKGNERLSAARWHPTSSRDSCLNSVVLASVAGSIFLTGVPQTNVCSSTLRIAPVSALSPPRVRATRERTLKPPHACATSQGTG